MTTQSPLVERIIPGSLAFVFAHGEEAAGLKRKLVDRVTTRCVSLLEHSGTCEQMPIVIAETGGGFKRAARATRDLIIMRRPRWIIAAGFAASLQPAVQVGHVVIPNRVCDQDGKDWSVEYQVEEAAVQAQTALHVGSLASLPVLPSSEEETRVLLESTQALACDTHTRAVAEECHREQVPFLAARIIDRDRSTGPVPDLEPVDRQATRAGKLGAAARALFQRPGSIQDMWKQKKLAGQLSEGLGRFLVGMIQQLRLRDVGEPGEESSPG